MSAIKSTEERTHIGTLTKEKARMLTIAKQRAVAAANAAKEAEDIYGAMLTLAMPAGANEFDPNTMSFFYNPARNPGQPEGDPVGEASASAGDTDAS
jgi:hypothetical protein